MIRHVSLLHLWQVTTGLNQYQKYIYQIVHLLFFLCPLSLLPFFPLACMVFLFLSLLYMICILIKSAEIMIIQCHALDFH